MTNPAPDADSILEQLTPIQEFMKDPNLTEIVVNRPGEVRTEGHGVGWQVHSVSAVTDKWCRDLGKLIANRVYAKWTQEEPSLSAVLPNGERIQIVQAPRVAVGMTSITIRKPSSILKALEEFVLEGFFEKTRHEQSLRLRGQERDEIEGDLPEDEIELLSLLRSKNYVEFIKLAVIQKRNIVLSGATGAGKTTLANAIAGCIPAGEGRIITVEDVPEMRLPHVEQHIQMFYQKTVPGSAKAVFEDTLRMYPSRVLPAELRGDEAYFFIQNVLNSGHPGTITTVHANTTKLAFLRLSLMIQSSKEGSALPQEAILATLHSLIDVVIQVVKQTDGRRVVSEIYFDPAYARQQVG